MVVGGEVGVEVLVGGNGVVEIGVGEVVGFGDGVVYKVLVWICESGMKGNIFLMVLLMNFLLVMRFFSLLIILLVLLELIFL